MSRVIRHDSEQLDLNFEDAHYDQVLLDQLLADSHLYKTSAEFRELQSFIIRLRNVAPFNALLLHIQKPGLTHAATARDWKERFHRTPKAHARPLLILRPFGPVDLVYDILDTEGEALPEDAFAFQARGAIQDVHIQEFIDILGQKQIHVEPFDQGDGNAGSIERLTTGADKNTYSVYRVRINGNHQAPTRFATLAHELAHLFLGHLGTDLKLKIKARARDYQTQEWEAEAVAYLVCNRNGVTISSHTYLNHFTKPFETPPPLDLYVITRAAGQIERLLAL
jgi:hypothetical protein